jgi:uncharacterized ferredoxin-like protein
MILKEKEFSEETLLQVAKKMALAARTAPKARGINTIEILIVTSETINQLAFKMKEIGEKHDQAFFLRDAGNLEHAPVVVLLGTKIQSIGLKKCGLCGFKNCEEKNEYPTVPCAFNTGDLGIALGSAVSVAADNRIDNRIMYTIGQAALELGIFDKDIRVVYGIPLSASSKSPFFDRK